MWNSELDVKYIIEDIASGQSYRNQTGCSRDMWETFLLNTSPHSYFQAWEWGEIEKELGKRVLRIGLYSGKNLIGVSQIVKVKAKRGTFLHVRNGPVFSKWNLQTINVWLKFVKDLAYKENASFIRISPLIDKSYAKHIAPYGFRSAQIQIMDGEVVRRIKLDKSEKELLSMMRKTTRNLIRKAKKCNVVIKKSNNLKDFHKLNKQTYTRHGFVPHGAIDEEYWIFSRKGRAELYYALHEKTPLASAIIVYYGNQAIYRHGASKKTKIPCSYLLQWHAIKEAKKRGMQYYNLFGIADTDRTSHPWWGLTQFKKGFGGETVSYLHAHDLPLNAKYWFNWLVETIRKHKRKY